MTTLNKIAARCNAIEAEMAGWTDAEHEATIGFMWKIRLGTRLFFYVAFLIAMANPVAHPVHDWELHPYSMTMGRIITFFSLLASPYILTCYAYRILSLRQLIGPVTWLRVWVLGQSDLVLSLRPLIGRLFRLVTWVSGRFVR